MKRKLAVILLLALLLSGCGKNKAQPDVIQATEAGQAEEVAADTTLSETYYVFNCKESIPLFSFPNINSEKLCQIPLGEGVLYLQPAEEGFCYVKYLAHSGYVKTANLSTDLKYANKLATYYVSNCEQFITLRVAPNTSARTVCDIPLGASVNILRTAEHGFLKVIYNGLVGYAPEANLAHISLDQQQSRTPYYVVNCKESITLRKTPRTDANEYCQIPLGAEVAYVESATNGFFRVSYGGYTGYALAAYLSRTPPAGVELPQESNEETTTDILYYVTGSKGSIPLMSSLRSTAKEYCQIPESAAVTFVETAANGYLRVSYKGRTGYAQSEYLSLEQKETLTIYYVVDCNESITLRTSPRTDAKEYCQIPLGAPVIFRENAANGFLRVSYDGHTGYALAQYLAETDSKETEDVQTLCYVVNCRESVPFQSTPREGAKEYCQIPLYTELTYIEEAANGFCRVSYEGHTGYIPSANISFAKPAEAADNTAYMTVVNCQSFITLRAAASTGAKALCQIPLGSQVEYLGPGENGFCRIAYDGHEGYALESYLQ